MISNSDLAFLDAHYRYIAPIYNFTPHPIGAVTIEYSPSEKLFRYGVPHFKIIFNPKDLRSHRKTIRLNHKLIKFMISKAEPMPIVNWG